MSKDTDNELKERARKAKLISEKPEGYKVCEGCESIVVKKAATCPNCGSYRFDESAGRVIEQAEILGRRRALSLSPKDFE